MYKRSLLLADARNKQSLLLADARNKTSVAIPAHNEQNYIEACLKSLARQTIAHRLEVIVCLNACTDHTEAVVRKFASSSQLPLKIVHEPRKGVAHARQCAFENAAGHIILSADADTEYPPDWAERIEKIFSSHPEVVEVYGPVRLKDYNSRFQKHLHQAIDTLVLWLGKLIGHENVIGSNFAVRRWAFENVGGFDTSLKALEDSEITRGLKKQGRVLFDKHLIVYASARRYNHWGFWWTATYYARNLIKLFWGKPPRDFEDVRAERG